MDFVSRLNKQSYSAITIFNWFLFLQCITSKKQDQLNHCHFLINFTPFSWVLNEWQLHYKRNNMFFHKWVTSDWCLWRPFFVFLVLTLSLLTFYSTLIQFKGFFPANPFNIFEKRKPWFWESFIECSVLLKLVQSCMAFSFIGSQFHYKSAIIQEI